MNYIRKHSLELAAKGVERPAARLFSNPAGDFGSMVNERVRAYELNRSIRIARNFLSFDLSRLNFFIFRREPK